MFSQIIRNVNLDVEPSTTISDEFAELLKLSQQSHLECEGISKLIVLSCKSLIIFLICCVYYTYFAIRSKEQIRRDQQGNKSL